MSFTTREYLENAALDREIVHRFLEHGARNWACFDTELGYILNNSCLKDGIDDAYTIAHYDSLGERRMINYRDHPCRINTYGNSFTQCHQVSDGETWQEYLAAHLGEPIRNFGVGGYGVYQAYRRMLREEVTQASAEHLILNIWSDDHFRSIYKWRMLHIPDFRRNYVATSKAETCMFHANPWAHVRLDAASGEFRECENPYATPKSLFQLCDKEHIYEAFRDDFEVQAFLAQHGATDVNLDVLENVARALDMQVDFNSPKVMAKTARGLLQECALRSSFYVVDKARAFAESTKKQLIIFLTYSRQDVLSACRGFGRFDQAFVDFLKANQFLFVDVLKMHVDDFNAFGCSPEDYIERYFIGHYNPKGNHFLAFAVKDRIIDWLNPKPPTYRKRGPSLQSLSVTQP